MRFPLQGYSGPLTQVVLLQRGVRTLPQLHIGRQPFTRERGHSRQFRRRWCCRIFSFAGAPASPEERFATVRRRAFPYLSFSVCYPAVGGTRSRLGALFENSAAHLLDWSSYGGTQLQVRACPCRFTPPQKAGGILNEASCSQIYFFAEGTAGD